MIVAFTNHKGGVGKTTLTLAFAMYLKRRYSDKNILLVDTDPQSNLTISLTDLIPQYTLLDAFRDVIDGNLSNPRRYVWESEILPDFFILPSTLNMIKEEPTFTIGAFRPTELLRTVLEPLRDFFDFILVDTPPSLGLWTKNALMAADYVVVPTLFDNISLFGLNDILFAVRAAQQYRGGKPILLGVIGNRLDLRYKVHHRNYLAIKKNLRGLFVEPAIPTSSRGAGNAKALYSALVKGDRARLRDSLITVFDALIERIESGGGWDVKEEEEAEAQARRSG